jgi:hypothetical protein
MMITRTSTIEQAHEWIVENLPNGSKIAIETRGLLLEPKAYKTTNVPRLVMDSRGPGYYEQYVEQGYQYVVASSQAFGPAISAPHQNTELYKAYMNLFEQSRELVRFAPSDQHPGPEIRIFALKKGTD